MDCKEKYLKVLSFFREKIEGRENLIVSKEDLETLFDELKESEDEKIRKELIRFHKSTIDINGIKGEDIIAWLEKQEERKTPKWVLEFLEECRPYIGCALGYDERREIEGKIVAIQKWLENPSSKE